jgi:hypothetical protein
MLITLVATIPPTLASLAAWWGVRGGPAWRERIEAQLKDLLAWQIDHGREHKTHIRRVGGQQ